MEDKTDFDGNELIPFVIIIRDNVVDEMIRCHNSAEAETIFIEQVKLHTGTNDQTQEYIDMILDDGCESFDDGSVCISWA